MITEPQKQLHPASQFFIFIGTALVFLFIGTFIGIAVAIGMYGVSSVTAISTFDLSSQAAVNALWIIQLCGTTLPIFFTAVFFAYVVVKDPDDYLHPHFEFSWKLLPVILILMALAFPVNEYLANVNAKLDVSSWAPGIQRWMHETEDAAQKISEGMMHMQTVGNLIAVVLFVGLLTAIVEEFMFRGVLQTIMYRWTKNIHVAVWITAILFSAFHQEFFGFLPRLFLGVLFGYFVAWSGSVWTSIWAHFINNAADVVLTYLAQHKMIGINPDDQHIFSTPIYVISFIFTLLLLFVYWYIAVRRAQTPES